MTAPDLPWAVLRHFGSNARPTIAQEFWPGRGWIPGSGADVTTRLGRQLRHAKCRAVAVRCDGRTADFAISEVAR